jgi:hypothetical protein
MVVEGLEHEGLCIFFEHGQNTNQRARRPRSQRSLRSQARFAQARFARPHGSLALARARPAGYRPRFFTGGVLSRLSPLTFR